MAYCGKLFITAINVEKTFTFLKIINKYKNIYFNYVAGLKLDKNVGYFIIS